MSVDLQPGDIFWVRGQGFLSKAIRAIEWIQSGDNEATYGHAGIITSSIGATMEALWVVERSHLDVHAGQPIQIARPILTLDGRPIMPEETERAIAALVAAHLGQPYPVWRIPLFLAPWIAKFAATGRHVVCSELQCRYLALIGARHLPYTGVTPDTSADEARRWGNIKVTLANGVWQRQ